MGAQRFLRKVQVGPETVYGTPVAATARLMAQAFNSTTTPGIHLPNHMNGMIADQHPGVKTSVQAGHSWDVEFTFEQILYALAMGLKGPITPSVTTGVYTWTHIPAVDGSDGFQSYTVQRRLSDGVTNYDYIYPGSLAKSIKISGAAGPDAVVMAVTDMFSLNETTSAITAALGLPTVVEMAPVNMAKVFIDPTWAGLGTTQIVAQNISFDWTLTTGLDLEWYMNGGYGASGYHRVKRSVTLQLTMDVAASSQALRAAIESRARQFVRVQLLGSDILGGSSNPRTCNLDGSYVVSAFPPEGERNGTETVQITLVSRVDPTSGKDLSVVVKNALAALP